MDYQILIELNQYVLLWVLSDCGDIQLSLLESAVGYYWIETFVFIFIKAVLPFLKIYCILT